MLVTGLFQPYKTGDTVFFNGEAATFLRSKGLFSEIEHAEYCQSGQSLLGVTRTWTNTYHLASCSQS